MSNKGRSINKTEDTFMSHMGHFCWCLVKKYTIILHSVENWDAILLQWLKRKK